MEDLYELLKKEKEYILKIKWYRDHYNGDLDFNYFRNDVMENGDHGWFIRASVASRVLVHYNDMEFDGRQAGVYYNATIAGRTSYPSDVVDANLYIIDEDYRFHINTTTDINLIISSLLPLVYNDLGNVRLRIFSYLTVSERIESFIR